MMERLNVQICDSTLMESNTSYFIAFYTLHIVKSSSNITLNVWVKTSPCQLTGICIRAMTLLHFRKTVKIKSHDFKWISFTWPMQTVRKGLDQGQLNTLNWLYQASSSMQMWDKVVPIFVTNRRFISIGTISTHLHSMLSLSSTD